VHPGSEDPRQNLLVLISPIGLASAQLWLAWLSSLRGCLSYRRRLTKTSLKDSGYWECLRSKLMPSCAYGWTMKALVRTTAMYAVALFVILRSEVMPT
jgi:hypothetical protein